MPLGRGGAEQDVRHHFSPRRALAKAEPEVLMRVEELDLPPTTAIRLNTAPAGEPPAWQALEDLSTGQKATAVLLLLLLESEAPLIVDQPEDDLDNRSELRSPEKSLSRVRGVFPRLFVFRAPLWASAIRPRGAFYSTLPPWPLASRLRSSGDRVTKDNPHGEPAPVTSGDCWK